MRFNFASRYLSVGPIALAIALASSGVACLSAHIVATDGGASGGTGGGSSGTGGSTSTGGNSGTGGNGVGGGAEAGSGGGGTGVGGSGAGGFVPDAGAGGAVVDAGTGGAPVDSGADDGSVVDAATGVTPNTLGQVVITEIMVNPVVVADDVGEWFELYNPSATDAVDLFGCTFNDSSNSNQDGVLVHLLMPPNGFATFARFGDASGGFVPTFDYHVIPLVTTDVKFGNSGDLLMMRCNGITIDSVDFTTWVIPQGASLSLDPRHYSATENDVQSNWCPAVPPAAYHMTAAGTDFGTPGVGNPTCP